MRTSRRCPKGQALVEFALVLPLLLFVILEGLQLSLLYLAYSRLDFAVMQGAIAGAQTETVPDRCDVAHTTLLNVLQREIDTFQCTGIGELLEVTASRHFRAISPFHADPISIEVTESAPIPK